MINNPHFAPPVGWCVEASPVGYEEAVAAMELRAAGIVAKTAGEIIWLLEHPPLYTAGSSADARDLIDPGRFPVHRTGRGGQYTYHGPGQRVAYVMLDVGRRFGDVRAFVRALEDWLTATLLQFNVRGERRDTRVGIWVERPDKCAPGGGLAEDKIAAIGIRLRRWVSYHGISLNVEPDLSHFTGIVPCGIADHGVTSLADLGLTVTMEDADLALKSAFRTVFGPELAGSQSPLADLPVKDSAVRCQTP